LRSNDGLIIGRPDLLDRESRTVVDYKTGMTAGGPNEVSEREARQLRLYAFLAREAGLSVSRGAIVRSDGRKAEIQLSDLEITEEACKARTQLQSINSASSQGQRFDDLASPSAENCTLCPCAVVCERFWQNATPEWFSTCGVFIEGRVTAVAERAQLGFQVVTLDIEVQKGTVGTRFASIEQIPRAWLLIEESCLPAVGDIVRITDARHSRTEGEIAVIRVDRALTNVWVIGPTALRTSAQHPTQE
jgi:hypothetical protein